MRVQTASLVAAPHGLAPVALDELIECDVGSWEGLDWQAIRRLDADGYRRFHADPAEFGYPGGESFRTVHERILPVMDELLERHRGETVLIVAHNVVNRVYLADLLGLGLGQAPTSQARQLRHFRGGARRRWNDGQYAQRGFSPSRRGGLNAAFAVLFCAGTPKNPSRYISFAVLVQ